jgi:trans-aconitate methyltransferase
MDKWHEIWNKRSPINESNRGLDALIKLDGFDSGAGMVSVDDWIENTKRTVNLLNIKNGDSVFEVGCGCGAFLKGLQEHRTLKIGGVDYSSPLIDVAREALPDGEFICGEASDISGINDYDSVIAHGVFHYFSLDYADVVIQKMILKARKTICILDVPNIDTMEESEQMRREQLSEEEYKIKYEGLEHTYFNKTWFSDVASKNGYSCEFVEGMMPNYIQKDYRYGVLIKKNV